MALGGYLDYHQLDLQPQRSTHLACLRFQLKLRLRELSLDSIGSSLSFWTSTGRLYNADDLVMVSGQIG